MKKILLSSLGTTALLESMVLAAKTWWFFELFSHYTVYLTILALILTLTSLLQQYWKLGLVFLTLGIMSFASFAPYLIHTPLSVHEFNKALELRILSQNFYYKNENFNEVQELLKHYPTDVFIIHEAGPEWKTALESFKNEYPYQGQSHLLGVQGMVMGSRIEGSFQEIPLGTKWGLEFQPKNKAYQILAVHPLAPLTPAWAKERNQQFKDLIEYVKLHSTPTLLVGDFNCTPWSPYFLELLIEGDLSDARLGFGLLPTWHAHNPLFKLPIDHLLHTPEWTVLSFKTTPKISSDHLGIYSQLLLPVDQ